MPVEFGIWKMGKKLERISTVSMDSEKRLEDAIADDLSILGDTGKLMLLDRQVQTSTGKYIDLLAMDIEGNLVVIELKRDRTPREVVAQVLDYGAWVQELSRDEISDLFTRRHPGQSLEKGFAEAFGESGEDATLPGKVNQGHRLVVVASELDASTERIINYLAEGFGVPINAVFFQLFRDGANEYLARTWLIDPEEAEAKSGRAVRQRGGEPWNGRDFYVGIGVSEHRAWEDCVKYGFVSGGQGKWYSQTLGLLFPGARIFVNIPKSGYVGVGVVEEPVVPVKEFMVTVDGKRIPILSAPLKAPMMGEHSDDPEQSEYLVRVKWLHIMDPIFWTVVMRIKWAGRRKQEVGNRDQEAQEL